MTDPACGYEEGWRGLPSVRTCHGRRNVMRGSGLIWTIVGVLLIIALIIYIF
jgi:hypothetical protein